jgi:hypothetical protein
VGGRNPEVDAWFDRYENPRKDVVLAVRVTELIRAWIAARDAD